MHKWKYEWIKVYNLYDFNEHQNCKNANHSTSIYLNYTDTVYIFMWNICMVKQIDKNNDLKTYYMIKYQVIVGFCFFREWNF